MKQGKIPFVFGSALLAAGMLFSGGVAVAQDKPLAPPSAREIKDARALDLLKNMSGKLTKAKTLSFKVRGLVPFASPTGQYISLFASSRVVMQRPDKLFVESRGDLFPNDLYFDGKAVTTIEHSRKFYTQKEASGNTIDALIENKHPGTDVLAIFAEMLVSDPYSTLTRDLSSALWVGQSIVGGVKTDHLAFTGKGLDWEIWIGERDKLPVMMVVSHREGERQPTFTVEFSDWKLDAPIPANTFNATIPKDAVKLEFKPQDLSQAK
ncbi:DUF2092 domain-containing protein [Propionivibrio sp.]|uniref:DUF2092 domain-containing protein n=1 Tax=Propionivibrio sp. TaxID=2212460 RepID=UPI003BEF6473